jgi:HK97 family phage prohead protease
VKAGTEERQVQFVISSAAVDRMGDTISVDGWDLGNFKKNPVVLWSHDPTMPIGVADKIWAEGGKLKAIAEFQPADINPFADSIYKMLTHPKRFLRATSVGFIPKEYAFSKDPNRTFGVDFLKQELTEFSICAIPANPEALMGAKSAGIDIAPFRLWAEKLLDGEGFVVMPRKHLEAIYALPGKFRTLAGSLPEKAKGARGQLIRCANMAEKTIKVDEPEIHVIEDEDIMPPVVETQPVVEADAAPDQAAPEMTDEAKAKMEAARQRVMKIKRELARG